MSFFGPQKARFQSLFLSLLMSVLRLGDMAALNIYCDILNFVCVALTLHAQFENTYEQKI